MCLISLAWQMCDDRPLVIAANRDEFLARDSAALHFWENSRLLAGKDLVAGGTWMGFHPNGRFAALTNIRLPQYFKANQHSRGGLITDFLASRQTLSDWTTKLLETHSLYSGFNLVFGDHQQLYHFNSDTGVLRSLAAGVYALSNADIDSPWPKVRLAKTQMEAWLQQPDFDTLACLHADSSIASDSLLPSTGISLDFERALSAQCIQLPDYATRVQTAAWVTQKGVLRVRETNVQTDAVHEFTMESFWPVADLGATG